MDLMRAVDAYCERLGSGVWDEPVNAVTNLAFVLVALFLWRQSGSVPFARALCVVLAGIGVSSGLWHTFAVVWTGAADTLSILVFILLYLYVANRTFMALSPLYAGLGVVLFFPYAIAVGLAAGQVPWLGSSAGYVPVAVLIAAYAAWLWRSAPQTAQGLAVGAALLCVSLFARTVDDPVCQVFPLGTHFLWHLINAIMLGWMIHVYVRAWRD